jgi:hypothetical protein
VGTGLNVAQDEPILIAGKVMGRFAGGTHQRVAWPVARPRSSVYLSVVIPSLFRPLSLPSSASIVVPHQLDSGDAPRTTPTLWRPSAGQSCGVAMSPRGVLDNSVRDVYRSQGRPASAHLHGAFPGTICLSLYSSTHNIVSTQLAYAPLVLVEHQHGLCVDRRLWHCILRELSLRICPLGVPCHTQAPLFRRRYKRTFVYIQFELSTVLSCRLPFFPCSHSCKFQQC